MSNEKSEFWSLLGLGLCVFFIAFGIGGCYFIVQESDIRANAVKVERNQK